MGLIINPIFEPLFNPLEKRRYRQVYGGRGSGKSFALSVNSVEKTYRDEPRKILYLRQTMSSSEDSTYSDVKAAMKMLGVEGDFEERGGNFHNRITGNQIIFKGIRATGAQSAKLKSLSGVTDLIIEEAEEVESFEEFSKVDESIRLKGVDITVTLVYNPTSASKSWIHKEWFIDGQPDPDRDYDTVYLHSTYLDNLENLAESTIQRYRDLKDKNPVYYINTILAEWTLEVEGRIYEGWRTVEELPTLPPGEKYEEWYCLDFGYGGKDDTALGKISYYKGKYFIKELFSKPYLRIGQTTELMRKEDNLYGSLIVADSAAPTLIDEVKAAGFRKIKPARKGIVEQQIKKVQDLDITLIGDNPHIDHAVLTFGRKKNGTLPHEPDILAAFRYGLLYKKTSNKNSKGGGRVIKTGGLI